MNTAQLNKALTNNVVTKKNFAGVFPIDKIPKLKNKPKKKLFFIFNLDPSYKSGSHWVSVMLNPRGKNCFFDSYGWPPNLRIKNMMRNNFNYNRHQLQHPLSTSCGQWCIFFIWEKMKGLSLTEITSKFSRSMFLANDHIMNSIVQRRFKTQQKVIDKHFLKSQICKKLEENGQLCPFKQK